METQEEEQKAEEESETKAEEEEAPVEEAREEEAPVEEAREEDAPVEEAEEVNSKKEEEEKAEEEPPEKKRKMEEGDQVELKEDEKAKEEEGGDKEPEKKRPPELEKFWKAVTDDPTDFTGWTYLLQYVDTNGEPWQAREAYDAFLNRYPYCYGYWKKYADYEKRKGAASGNKERCMLVFERGIKAIPLSVDLWIHYLNHVKADYADQPEFVRTQYERALATCGREWRSDKLWDHFAKWETSEQKNLPGVLKLYDRIIRNPTQGLAHQFEMFRDFVKEHNPKDLLEVNEFLALRKEVLDSLNKEKEKKDDEKKDDEGGAPGEDDSRVTTDEENQALREKIIFARRKVFKDTEESVGYRWKYEDQIKRPYFHMKPLERGQLKNWSDYLDDEIERQGKDGGDETIVEILFERCLIACALYEEFWVKYVRWLTQTSKAGTEEERWARTRHVFERAVTHHLPTKVDIHLRYAAFEEECGHFDKAAEVLEKLGEKHSSLLSLMLRRINLERRRGNTSEVHRLYKDCIGREKLSTTTRSDLSVKYSRFLRLVLDDTARAMDTVEAALKEDDANPKLYMQQLDILMHLHPLDTEKVVALLDRAMDKMAAMKHKLLFSQRKVEFLEDFGSDIKQLLAAQERHSKLAAEIRAAAAKSSDPAAGDSASTATNGEVGSGIKTIEGRSGGLKKPSNGSSGTTTYAATNSASYSAHHTSQYQQYGSRYQQYPPSGSSGGYYGSGGYGGGGGGGGGSYYGSYGSGGYGGGGY